MLIHKLLPIPRIVSAMSVMAVIVAGCGGSSTAAPSTNPTTPSDSPTPPATSLEQRFVSVVRQTQPSVAQIQTDQARPRNGDAARDRAAG